MSLWWKNQAQNGCFCKFYSPWCRLVKISGWTYRPSDGLFPILGTAIYCARNRRAACDTITVSPASSGLRSQALPISSSSILLAPRSRPRKQTRTREERKNEDEDESARGSLPLFSRNTNSYTIEFFTYDSVVWSFNICAWVLFRIQKLVLRILLGGVSDRRDK